MKRLGTLLLTLTAFVLLGSCGPRPERAGDVWQIVSDRTIDLCAADFDIKYSMFVRDGEIYAAYYDKEHRLKIAKHDSIGEWSYASLDENVGWDSHCYISLAVDREGTIHISGNMHNDPLVYYRSEVPGDISTIRKRPMTMILEDSVTYPGFLQTEDMLVFHYRNGRSGNGSTYFNTYDFGSGTWRKLCMEPLFDGLRAANSYFKGPFAGRDGKFHLIWCWRDDPDCSTNHGLYYAFSEDLKEWHTPSGHSKMVPLTPADDEFLVDDIKIKEGLINGGFEVGFDEGLNPVIAYHKYDENDHTNLYSAVFKDGGWDCRRITDWDWKWEFSGRGSIPFELVLHRVWQDGAIRYFYISKAVKRGLFRKREMVDYLVSYDVTTGGAAEELYSDNPYSLDEAAIRGLLVHKEFDCGQTAVDDSLKYLLRYETAFPVRDKKRNGTVGTSPLRVVEIRK